MSINGNRLYLFGDFSFDAEERVLLRHGKPLSLTPKTLKLLGVLIGNHGRIVEKERLMAEVWADSFVEDSNLTFTVRQLRKALADDAHKPTYIETVPRRGYRFIGEVRQISNNAKAALALSETNLPAETIPPPTEKEFARSKFKNFYILLIAAFLVGTIAFAFQSGQNGKASVDVPILNQPFSSEKLSTDGKVFHAVVSPDGKNVVYTTGFKERQSVWLRQLETSNSVEIIAPSDDFYFGLAFSPDGNFLYFTRKPKNVERQADIFRVSIFGGVPQKIIGETQGWISVAPDGRQISFVRCFYLEEENCSLWIADAPDGKNERKIASRPHPFRIGDNRISPDGRTVAFAAGQSRTGANEFGLIAVDIETGAERELTAQKFFNIKSLEWLPDESGLLVTASKIPNRSFRIWQISAESGDTTPLTKDSEQYDDLSLSRAADVLIATQVTDDFRIHLFDAENPFAAPQILAAAATVAFAPDGKIIFSSAMTGNSEIWSVNADGSERRQLTGNAADDWAAAISPDNNSIFFASNRTGETHVWRMNADGGNQTQITTIEGGFPIAVSPDGLFVYYSSALQKTLRRASTAGGAEEVVLDKSNLHFAVSPDGLYVAFAERQGENTILNVAALIDKQIVKVFQIPNEKSNLTHLAWSPDGKSLAYILADGEFKNNALWRQPLADQRRAPQQVADLGDAEISELFGFALAPDGKHFAVAQGGWLHDAVLLKGLK